LDALVDDRLPADEPVEPKFGALDTVTRKLFFNDALPAWPQGEWPPAQAPDWLRLGGMMPPGRPGLQAWQDSAQAVEMLLERLGGLVGFEQAVPAPVTVAVSIEVGRIALSGQVEHVYVVDTEGRECWQILRALPGKDGKL